MKQFLTTLFMAFCLLGQTHADTHTVNAGGFYYSPSTITITIGDTVVWINDGGTHDVNGAVNAQTGQAYNNPESFNSNATSTAGAEIYTHVFTVPGTYNYDCSVGNHAAQGMTGTIIVEGTVFDVIAASESHTTLETALITAGLDVALNGNGPFTVFAPSNDAFANIPAADLENLLDNAAQLNAVLLHHVHGGDLSAQEVIAMDGMSIETLNNDQLMVTLNGSTVMIDMATVTATNLIADNGTVHVIDMVLMPETLTTVFDVIANSENHTQLENAILTTELDDALNGVGPLTVFAPSDDVFDELTEVALQALLNNTELLSSILLHHVHSGELMAADILTMDGMTISTLNDDELTVSISGQTVKIDMATVTTPDLTAINGVVHVIDMILMPEIDTTITVMDIVENSPIHANLKTAIYAAELDDDLRTDGPFTVFAPTDSAFNNLPAGFVDNLIENDIPTLTSILLHHVHNDEAMEEDLFDGMMVPTMNNDSLSVSIDGTTVMVDMATVIVADIPADNGVVHVIDMVLVPADPTSIDQYVSKEAIYMYSLNVLGEKVNRFINNQIVIDIYSDGSSIKRYNLAK